MTRKTYSLLLAVAFLFVLSGANYAQPKLKSEEIIGKNMDSIAGKERRGKLKNFFAVGLSQFASKLPEKKTGGKIVIVSNPDNFYFLSSFNSKEYPFEKIGFFGGDVSLPFVTAGTRSPLGAFIADHSKIMVDGLFGGSMSMRWTLAKGKFNAAGTKKINDRKAYVVEYLSGSGSDEFSVKLYFDAENFRHLRTEYRHIIANRQNQFGTFGVQTGVRLTMNEDFGDFKTVDDITLPYSYKITYLTESDQGVFNYEWTANIKEYYFNQNLDPKFFTFSTN